VLSPRLLSLDNSNEGDMDVVIVDGTDRYVMLRGCGFVMRFFDTIRFFCHGGLLVDLVVCLMDHILLRWYNGM
jgi:hypothetical protein